MWNEFKKSGVVKLSNNDFGLIDSQIFGGRKKFKTDSYSLLNEETATIKFVKVIMDKRIISLFLVFLFLVSTLSFIFAQNPLEGFANQMDNITSRIDETGQKVEKISREDAKWGYLSEQWKELLLKNRFVSTMDNFFKKGNKIFVVLFARDYSLSLTLFFLILVWFYFLNQFNKIFSAFSTFSSGTSWVISLGMTIILAQIRLFDWLSEIIFKLIFYRQGGWGLVWSIGIVIAVILVSMIFGRFLSSFKIIYKRMMEERKKKAREAGEEFHYNRIKTLGNALGEAFGLGKSD
jgi:hypothetical protein